MGLSGHIVDAGDTALLLPMSVVVFIACRAIGARRTALAWCLAIGCCGIAIVLLKIAVYANIPPLRIASLSSPSGHAALSTVVYGSLAVSVRSGGMSKYLQLGLLLVAGCLIAAIALASIRTGAHTATDIVAGLLVGVLSVMAFRWLSGRGGEDGIPLTLIALIVAVSFVGLYGREVELEPAIRSVGLSLQRL